MGKTGRNDTPHRSSHATGAWVDVWVHEGSEAAGWNKPGVRNSRRAHAPTQLSPDLEKPLLQAPHAVEPDEQLSLLASLQTFFAAASQISMQHVAAASGGGNVRLHVNGRAPKNTSR